MNRFHNITLVAASAALLAIGGTAMAQTVSGNDPYAQGFAAGAAAQRQNNFSAYDNGYLTGEQQQNANTQSYNNGYQAGLAQSNTDKSLAYNNGYQDRAAQDSNANDRAFDNGFRMGADEQARNDADYPD